MELTYFPLVLLGLPSRFRLLRFGCKTRTWTVPLIGRGLPVLTGTTTLLGHSGIMAVNVHDWTGLLLPLLLSLLPLASTVPRGRYC